MNLQNNICKVTISIDEGFRLESADNNYDYVLNPLDYEKDDYYKVYSIRIDLFTREYCFALVGDGNSYDDNCAILEEKTLTVLQGWDILQFDVLSGELEKRKTLDNTGCNFAIYKVDQDYIIYGEIDITSLNSDLETKWSFSGRDVFVSISGKTAFEIRENSICLYDFEDNYYEINFDGKLILDQPNKVQRHEKD